MLRREMIERSKTCESEILVLFLNGVNSCIVSQGRFTKQKCFALRE